MARVRGMHGDRLDSAIGRVETVVVRVLRGIAGRLARLVGGSPSPTALSDDDFQVIRRDWSEAVTVEIVPALADTFVESAEVLAKEFTDAGRPVEVVSLEAPAAADFLDAATNRLAVVSDTLWEVARKELADGVRAGEGIEELAARLQEAGGFGEARARMIARTEVVAASNASSLAQAMRVVDPSMVKEWLDSDDDRVRAAHEFADGQAVPVGEPFEVGGEFLMYPGQPIGSRGNVINERCTLGYSWDDEPLTAAAEVHTGAMVALRPSAADAKRLAVDGGEPADQLHVTLFYLGEAADFDEDTRAALINAIRSMVERRDIPAITAKGFGLSVFNPDGDEPCWVLDIGDQPDAGDDRLGVLRGAVEEAWHDGGVVFDLPEQHTPWRPHLTLIYDADLGWAQRLADRVGPVTFDSIWVAFGGDNTDIPLAPVAPTVAAAGTPDPAEPVHVGGVDLAGSGLQVDAWGDGTFSITDPDGGGFWLNEDEANALIDALNQVRSGGDATTINVGAGGLEVAVDDIGRVLLVPQNESAGWTLSDDDAYDLSYWLAYWLDKGGYYDDEGAELAEDPEPPLTAARRPWDPLKHPRGPDGRFIGKGLVGRASGATSSNVIRRSEPPSVTPPRPTPPDDPRRAELSRMRVAELRTLARERGVTPGRLRKADLIDQIADAEGRAPAAPAAPPLEPQAPAGVEERFAQAAAGQDALDSAGVRLVSTAGTQGGVSGEARLEWARGGDSGWTTEQATARATAIEDYRGADYRNINKRLRGNLSQDVIDVYAEGDPDRFLAKLDAQTSSMDDVFDRSRTDRDAIVWRGSLTGRGVFGDALDGDLTGHEWTEDAYTSTSAREDWAAQFGDFQMRILVPSGTGAVELSPLDDEAELLLDRGLRFRVVSDSGPDSLTRRVDAEVIGGGRPGRADGGVAGADVDGTGELPATNPGRGTDTGPGNTPAGAGGAVAGETPAGPEGSPERIAAATADIRGAVEQLREEPDDYVMLDEVRTALGDRYSRDEVDRALVEMNRGPDVSIVPESNQKVLTQAERDAAVEIGNQARHLITLIPPANPMSDGEKHSSRLERELREAEAAGDLDRVREIRAELDRRQARRDRLSRPNTPTPPQAPAAGVEPTEVAGAAVAGDRLPGPLAENLWGAVINPDVRVQFHDDGEIGEAIKSMGDDALLDVDGRPLGDVLGMLATDAVVGRSTSQDVLDKLKVLRDRLPEGSRGRRQLDVAIADLDAPVTPVPDVPEETPEALRQLMADLHAVPLVRRDPSLEEDPLADLLAQVASGRLQGRRLVSALRSLRNRRHESVEGKFEIDRAIDRALAALQPPRPAARPEGFASEDHMPDSTVSPSVEGDDFDWSVYFADAIDAWFQSRMPPQLQAHWIKELRLGAPGSFRKCVRELREHFLQDTEGLCANLYKTATGRWPGQKADHDTLTTEGDCPPGHHRMPGGECMPDADMATVETTADDGATMLLDAQPGEHFHTKVLEGVSTGMRQFAPGAISWRTPPFAYHWQYKSSAHNGIPETVQVGLVTRAERNDDTIHFWGRLDLRSPEGLDYARRLVEGFARWSSVGGDESVKDKDIDVEYVLDVESGESGEDPEIDLMTFGKFRVAEISGVSVPALADATVEPTQELINTLVAMGVIEPEQVAGEPPAVEEVQEDEVADFAAVRPHDTPTTEGTWDADANVGRLPTPLPVGTAREEFAWIDDSQIEGDHIPKGAGSLPHHEVSEDGQVGAANVDGVRNALARLSQTDMPEADREAVHAHLAAHLEDAGGEPSDLAADITTVVVAAGHTITLPDAPPAAWFDEPADDELPPYGSVRVDANGRLVGLLAPAQVNHRSFPGKKVKVPMGNVDYSGWQNKPLEVAEGHSINVGVITMDCGHASTNPGDWSYSNRREHYDNTCSIAARARAYEKPGIGVALAGGIVPWLDADGFGKLLASDLSGDWPPHPDRPGWRDFTAALAVPVGGFPNRARLRMAEGNLVAAAVPVHFDDDMEDSMEMETGEVPPLAEGTPVRVLDPRDPEVTEGEIAVVHPGPVYALTVPGRDEPIRWYVAEELEPADAMPPAKEAPVEVEELVASAAPDLRPALERVAKSVGLDARTRMESLRSRVHASD